MKPLNILYLGVGGGTSLHRAYALKRLGHRVHILSQYGFTPNHRIFHKWVNLTGALGLEGYIQRRLLSALPQDPFDLVWVDSGGLIGPDLVRELHRRYSMVINYNLDDPFGTRDGRLWRIYLQSVPLYDLIAVVREENTAEALAWGAKRVIKVFRSADEVAHAPRPLDPADWERWGSDVVFVGTWMPERGPFMAELVRRQVPLAIYGDNWKKAKDWPLLRSCWRGPGLHQADHYAKAIQCSKVCLGLLSKGNRDLHTQRSLEVPYLGGLLCAERTTEHTSLYRENEEAIFWSSAEECAEKCLQMLKDPPLRKCAAQQGRIRCLANRTTNENVMEDILNEAFSDS